MITVKSFTFNPIQENTYVLYDESGECVIIDPGCYDDRERQQMRQFLSDNKLRPLHLLNTHTHLDHIFGNAFIHREYKLEPRMHEKDLPVLAAFLASANLYGMNAEAAPEPGKFINEGDVISFGNSKLEIFFTPGHSPGSISFFSREDKFIIAGDVLFQGSIGRTDLPGGNFETLISSIKEKLFTLDDDFKVYSGHGPVTTIGFEKKHNPFL
jgi:glyoxylase-like metal-dependent hydrolase (beta-lactamase superfamily II)